MKLSFERAENAVERRLTPVVGGYRAYRLSKPIVGVGFVVAATLPPTLLLLAMIFGSERGFDSREAPSDGVECGAGSLRRPC